MDKHHAEILERIRKGSGKPTHHTFLEGYLGNDHPRYPISNPVLRSIAREWMRAHKELTAPQVAKLLTSMVRGESSTEKCMTGILLDYTSKEQRQFNPALFDQWLDHVQGWAEVDALCTGKYTHTEILSHWKEWKKLLRQFASDENINKRRASLVFLCAPLRKTDDEQLAAMVFTNVDRLKHEKEILITKAISWVLRSMEKHHRKALTEYVNANKDSLPKIAVRETLAKLNTGRKTKKR